MILSNVAIYEAIDSGRIILSSTDMHPANESRRQRQMTPDALAGTPLAI